MLTWLSKQLRRAKKNNLEEYTLEWHSVRRWSNSALQLCMHGAASKRTNGEDNFEIEMAAAPQPQPPPQSVE